MKKFKIIMITVYAVLLLMLVPIGINLLNSDDSSFVSRSENRDNKNLIVTEQRIFDDADILTPAQEEQLLKKINKVSVEKKTDIIIVTTKDVQGKTWMQYADDFYDTHDFGYEKTHGTGVVFLISLDTKSKQGRGAWISGSGDALKYINDKRSNSIFEEVKSDLKKNDYYNACNKFIIDTEKYMCVSSSVPVILTNRIVQLGLASLIAALIIGVMIFIFRNGTKLDSRTYLKQNSLKLNLVQDQFISQNTVVTRNSDSGGDGGHTSDGGFDHSGGGGSF